MQKTQEDRGSNPGLGRTPEVGNGNPLQYSCLEHPMDWGVWQVTVHGAAKNQTLLSNWKHTFKFTEEEDPKHIKAAFCIIN